MKVYKNSTLKKIWIVSAVLGVLSYIPIIVIGGGEEMSMYILLTPIFLPCVIIGIASFAFINWKKALIGFIAPIPVVSYLIECIKGLFHAFRSLIALFKKKDFVIGKTEQDVNNDE